MAKPKCKLIGTDGNPFSIIAKVEKVLRDAGLEKEMGNFNKQAYETDTYRDLLDVVEDFVEVE